MDLTKEKADRRLEEVRRKYMQFKRGVGNVDLLALKEEIQSFVDDLSSTNEDCKALLEEAEDMLIDVAIMIEEKRCQPLGTKGV